MMYKNLLLAGILFFATIAFGQNLYSGYTTDAIIEDSAEGEEILSSPTAASAPIESILSHPAVQKKKLSRFITQAIGYRTERQVHFIAHIRKEQLHGAWQSFYSNSQVCDSGSLDKGLPDGEWKTWYPNGQLKTVRNYSSEKYHYIKADLHRNHPKHQRYRITQYAQQRKKIAHYFKPAYQSGQSIVNANALLEKINYNTEGEGDRYIPPFTHSLHHGLYLNYHQDGSIKDSGYYENGLKHGVWMESANGGAVRSVGFYDHGYRSGQWKHYDKKGRLVSTDLYKRNKRETIKHYLKQQ